MNPADLLPLEPGLVAVTGDEGSGKTTLLRWLGGEAVAQFAPAPRPDGLWLDLALPGQDEHAPQQVWDGLRARCPRWDGGVQADLAQALG